jgi:hypothetical protein
MYKKVTPPNGDSHGPSSQNGTGGDHGHHKPSDGGDDKVVDADFEEAK